MAKTDVFRFFRDLAHQSDRVTELRTRSKQEVLTYARSAGYDFTESDFDDAVWGIEMFLAKKLGETPDFHFSLWETMWGKYYLEFLVDNSVGAVSDQDIQTFMTE